jgi:hypothetical protein
MADPVLSGSLGTFRLPEVLSFLDAGRKSGTLTLCNANREAQVFFDHGAVIYAGSNQPEFRLSAILLRKKRITTEQFEMIDALMLNDGGRFGELAIQQGIFTAPQLRDFLKIQVSEVLYDSFVWKEGTFTFAEELRLPDYAVTIAIDLANLIMEGARRIEEWEECERLLPDSSTIFRIVSNPQKGERITLSNDEWKLLFLVNGQRTIEMLVHEIDSTALQVYRVLYGLWSNKLIEPMIAETRVEETGDGAPPTGDETIRQDTLQVGGMATLHDIDDDTPLLVSPDARLSLRDVVKPTVAQFQLLEGDTPWRQFPLVEHEYLIGRQRENHIQLIDLGVSGFHARIYRGPAGYTIEDLQSRNGTWVNGERTVNVLLVDGDRVRFGSTELLYNVLFQPITTNADTVVR